MNFKEIIKEHKEIYFDNKHNLKEFLGLCSKEEIHWSAGNKSDELMYVYDWFEENGNHITIGINERYNKFYLVHSFPKVDFTYNDFRKLLIPFNLAEFLKNNGVKVLDGQQFNDMFNILDEHNIKYKDIKDKWHLAEGSGVFYYSSDGDNLITVYKKVKKEFKNILSYQDFLSLIHI
jgi:hypothetical protein